MIVDKTLKCVKAVQTVSRLNHANPGIMVNVNGNNTVIKSVAELRFY